MKSCVVHFFGILSMLLLVSCAVELKDKNKPPPVSGLSLTDSPGGLLSQSQVVSRFVGLNEPNLYQVELVWPETAGTLRISRGDRASALVRASSGIFSEANVTGGSTLNYRVEQLDQDEKLLASFEISVQVPVDVLLEGEIELRENTKWEAERIFIARNLLVRTLDKNLLIVTKELIADGGAVVNFSEGSEAGREQNGRSGGNIVIQAARARGLLNIRLRGEAGGQGRNGVIMGRESHPGCAGTNGGKGGNAGNLSVQVAENRGLQMSVENQGGQPGAAGRRGSVTYTAPVSEAVHGPCSPRTPDGVDGSPGRRGQVCMKMSTESNFVCQ